MKIKMKKMLGIILSFALMLGLIPGMSMTAYADGTTYNPASEYHDYDNLISNDTEVAISEVSGQTWYVIAYDSSSSTVTLLSKSGFGTHVFNSNTSKGNVYANSEIKTYVDGLTGEGQPLAGISSMISDLTLIDTLTAQGLSPTKRKGAGTSWWLCSKGLGGDDCAAQVIGMTGYVDDFGVFVNSTTLGVRPALKLNLTKVTFDSNTKTFSTSPATVTTAPQAKTLTYNGQAQELVTAGTATGGTMQYALGSDATTAPADNLYTTSIPTATDAGTYYVWYKAVGDDSHSDSDPACITSVIMKVEAAGFYSGLKITQKKGKIKVSWDKTEGVSKYGVFIAYCGKDYPKKAVKTTKNNSVTFKKINGKKIDFTKNIKIYVEAFDNGGASVGKSISGHVAGKNSTKNKNPKSISVSNMNLTLSTGAASKIKATVKMEKGDKKAFKDDHVAKLRYRSTDVNVVRVDKNGKVTAVGAGTCKIYVYAQNGLAVKVSVTVN